MPDNRRVARVAEMIKREVSQLLFSGIKDERVGTGMVSVTNVNVSGDLQHAKVFVSIYGSDEAKDQTMQGLRAATGYVRSELGRRVRLRRTPEIMFVEDRGIEEGTRVISLINQISRDSKPLEDLEAKAEGTDAEPSDSGKDDLAGDSLAGDDLDSVPAAED